MAKWGKRARGLSRERAGREGRRRCKKAAVGYEHGKGHEQAAGGAQSQTFKLGPVLWDG